MVRVTSTQSPRLCVQWVDAAEAAHFHVSLETLSTDLSRFPSSSGASNSHTCDEVCA